MKAFGKTMLVMGLILALALPALAGDDPAQVYPSLAGVKDPKMVWDLRTSDPQNALDHLTLVKATVTDPALTSLGKVQAAVIFMGPSPLLLTGSSAGMDPMRAKMAGQIMGVLKELSQAGVKLEVCMVAVSYFNLDPAALPDLVKKVPNGWVSVTGYQAQGYALIPIY